MYKPSSNSRQASLFWDLETMLDSKHPLFKLANMIDWSLFEKSFAPLFCADNGRPPKPIRLMTGLLMLKHLRNVSDEQVVVQFTENAYYQYFCGLEAFSISAPCASSELVHFRHRIGEEGVELILKESIRINLAMEDKKKEEDDRNKGKDGRGRKSDHRLGRNFYKGLFGDSINVMLAAAAYNLKRAMRLFLGLFKWVFRRLMTEGQWSVITYNAFICAHVRNF